MSAETSKRPARRSAKPKAESVDGKRPVGRPTKYEPRFCDEVMADMAEGYSLTAFAGKIGVSRGTLNEWAEAHPEFSEAVSRAKAARLRKWEALGLGVAANGSGGPGAATVIVFGLKNMGDDEWTAPDKVEHSGRVDTVTTVELVGPDDQG